MDSESGEMHKGASDTHGAGGAEDARPSSGFGCMAITRTTLRACEFLLSLICFSLVASSGLLGYSACAFLLSMGVLTCIYTIAALSLLLVAILVPSSELTYKLPRPLLVTDFVMLVLLFSASCTAAGSINQGLVYWYQAYSYGSGAVAMGFFASFCLMADFWLTLIPVFVEIC